MRMTYRHLNWVQSDQNPVLLIVKLHAWHVEIHCVLRKSGRGTMRNFKIQHFLLIGWDLVYKIWYSMACCNICVEYRAPLVIFQVDAAAKATCPAYKILTLIYISSNSRKRFWMIPQDAFSWVSSMYHWNYCSITQLTHSRVPIC